MRFTILGFLLGTFAFQASSHAASYFLDPVNGSASCSASQSGCNSSACPSYTALKSAVGTLKPGDVVNFCAGPYRETITISENGSAANPIVLRKASSAGAPELLGTDECSTWASVGSGVYSCSFTPKMSGCTNSPQKLFVNRVPVAKAQASGCPGSITSLAANSWCYNAATAKVHLHLSANADPNDRSIEIGSRANAILMGSRSNITIDGLSFFGQEGYCTGNEYAIEAPSAGAGIKILNNTFDFTGPVLYLTGATDPVISHNTIRDMAMGWSWPLVPDGGSISLIRTQNAQGSLTVTHNTITRAGTHVWAKGLSNNCGGNASGNTASCNVFALSLQSTSGLLHVDDNVLTDIENGIAVKLDHGAVIERGSTIARNIMRGWAHPGVRPYNSQDGNLSIFCEEDRIGHATGGALDCTTAPEPRPVFRELKIVNNWMQGGFRGGILVSAADKKPEDAYAVLIANNIVVSGDYNFGNHQDAALWLYKGTSGVRVYNNTFQCQDNGSGLAIGYTAGNVAGTARGDFQNNIFDFDGCAKKISGSTSASTWNQASNLCDVAIPGVCRVGANTLTYRNEAGTDLHLNSTGNTEARGTASVLAGISTDFDAQVRSGLWDIGADQVSNEPVVKKPVAPKLQSAKGVP